MGRQAPIVYIIDSDESVRNSLRTLFKSVSLRTQSFATAQQFLNRYDPEQPGCLIAESHLPDMSGLELQEQLNLRGAIIPVIFVATDGDVPTVVAAMQLGAFDFLQRPLHNKVLVDRIQSALSEDASVRAELSERARVKEHFNSLTPREREVLTLITSGKPNKAVADALRVSRRTVELHRARVMEKMQAASLAQLVRMMMDL